MKNLLPPLYLELDFIQLKAFLPYHLITINNLFKLSINFGNFQAL
jgi:hypothetical protein